MCDAKAQRLDSFLAGCSDARGIERMLIDGLNIEGKSITSAGEWRVYPLQAGDIRFQRRSE